MQAICCLRKLYKDETLRAVDSIFTNPTEVKSMKKRSWAKHWLLAGSIMLVACACQVKNNTYSGSPSQDTEDSGSSDDDDSSNSDDDSDDQTSGTAPASNTEKADVPVAQPVAEKAPVAAPTPSPSMMVVPEVKAEKPTSSTDAPKLEAVSAVPESRTPTLPKSP